MDEPGPGVFVGIGSNLEPDTHIPAALEALNRLCPILAVSTFYRSAALRRPGLPDFVNGVCAIETQAPPRAVKFDVLRRVEDEAGRVRGGDPWGSRTIDLDLLVYDGEVANDDGFTLPDPDIRDRPFVAGPLLELAPRLVLPDTGEALASLAVAHQTGGLAVARPLTAMLCARYGGPEAFRPDGC